MTFLYVYLAFSSRFEEIGFEQLKVNTDASLKRLFKFHEFQHVHHKNKGIYPVFGAKVERLIKDVRADRWAVDVAN